MIVMKFGGTSVQDAKAIERAGAIVKGRLEQKPVVVVSAMAKVTDQLLAMARAAGAGDRKTALKLCRALQERHYNTAGELLGTALFTQFHGDLGADFETLEELLRGIAAVGELTPRTTDYVSAFGEILSSKIVAAAFSALGMPSALVDSREWLVTDGAHMRAAPLFEETNQRLQSRVAPLLAAGKVPVMGGFIGAIEGRSHDHDRPRRLGLFGRHRGRWAGSRAHRNMDRRGRHDDDRPAHVSRRPAHQGDQLR